jgi:hypothetical protein
MNESASSPGSPEDPAREAGDAPPPASSAPPAPLPPRPSFARRHWGKLTLLTILAIPLAGLALWVVIGLNYTYSTGVRPGMVQKMTRKGWLCKTWEGTLYTEASPGFRADSFNFTVRNDSLAKVIQQLSGKRVAVSYDQHTLVPLSCFGDTEYFVTGVRVVEP